MESGDLRDWKEQDLPGSVGKTDPRELGGLYDGKV